MKWKLEVGEEPLPPEFCRDDYAQAQELGRVRLGQLGLYYPHLTWVGLLPLKEIQRAYLRVEDIPVGMGCRRVPMGQVYLMAVLRSGESRKAALTGRKEGDWALEQLRQLAPAIQIGYQTPALVGEGASECEASHVDSDTGQRRKKPI